MRVYILTILAITAAITLLHIPGAKVQTCVVDRIIDGDTIVCDGQRLRFVSINAAENNTTAGVRATQTLRDCLPINTRVHLIPSPDGRTHDIYNRRLADIYIPGREGKALQSCLKEVNTQYAR